MMLEFRVRGQAISRLDNRLVAANVLNFLTCRFDVSSEWYKVTPYIVISAVFERDGHAYRVLLDSDMTCAVPHEVLSDSGFFEVSLVGVCADENGTPFRATANKVKICVEPSGSLDAENSARPTESELEQIESRIAELGTRLTCVFSVDSMQSLCGTDGIDHYFIWSAPDTEYEGGTVLYNGGIYTVNHGSSGYTVTLVTTLAGKEGAQGEKGDPGEPLKVVRNSEELASWCSAVPATAQFAYCLAAQDFSFSFTLGAADISGNMYAGDVWRFANATYALDLCYNIIGADGTAPHIGENGNWWIGDTDTCVPAASGGSAQSTVDTHNTAADAHSDIRLLISELNEYVGTLPEETGAKSVAEYAYLIGSDCLDYNAYRAEQISELRRMKCSLIPQGTAIDEGNDLNTVKFLSVGNYYCNYSAKAKTLVNCPVSVAFMMQVYSPLSTTVDNETTKTYCYRVRKLMTCDGDEYIQRAWSGSTAGTFNFGKWEKILKDTDTDVFSATVESALNEAKESGEFNGADGEDGKDGVGIAGIMQTETSAADGGTNVLTITLDNGTVSTLVVKNGSKGSTGAQGEQGEKGGQGEKGDTGAAGADGRSAYEYAQDGGYTGTETEFSAMLAQAVSSGSVTQTVLSDNLFDVSAAVTGKNWYHSSSGATLIDCENAFYAYVPLRGAGTYRTILWWTHHGSSYALRVPILKEDHSFLQYVSGTLTDIDGTFGYLEFTVTDEMVTNGAAVYAYGGMDTGDPYTKEDLMIIKDREYPDTYIPYGYVEVTVEADETAEPVNILSGKTAVFLGDSICAGTTTLADAPEYGYGWAGLIGEANSMKWGNYGRNGGTVTGLEGVDSARWLTTQVKTAYETYHDSDYVIFEGGCNDADQMGDDLLGEISSDYATFDTATFSGAFETLVLKILNTYPNAKVGYVIPPKMYAVNDHTADGHVHRRFFDRAAEICRKWGVPVIDLWNGCPLNPKLSVYYDSSLSADEANEQGKYYTDGQHLTLTGYQYISPLIEAWMRNLY